jgi:mono/diheme cytochrome c family protein
LNLRNRFRCLLAAALMTAWFAAPLGLGFPVALANNSQKRETRTLAQPRNDESVYAEIAKAPAEARAKRNPFENDAKAIAAGSKLFEQHCAECHGNMAEGSKKAPSLREDEVQRAEPGALFWVLTNGVVRRGHARMVEAAGAAALANRLVSEITAVGISTLRRPFGLYRGRAEAG